MMREGSNVPKSSQFGARVAVLAFIIVEVAGGVGEAMATLAACT